MSQNCVWFQPWLHVKQNYFEITSKLFQCFISHATTSETEIKLFQPLKLFQNYFSDIGHVGKYSWVAISFSQNEINNFRQILRAKNYFSRTSTKAEVFKSQFLSSKWPILVEFRLASSEIRRRKQRRKKKEKEEESRKNISPPTTMSGGLINTNKRTNR